MTTISLPARITMAEGRATLAQLQPQLQAADTLVIDASNLATLDTAALAVLLDCQRQAQARSKPLQVVGAPAQLSQLATLYGVAELLGIGAQASPAPVSDGGDQGLV